MPFLFLHADCFKQLSTMKQHTFFSIRKWFFRIFTLLIILQILFYLWKWAASYFFF